MTHESVVPTASGAVIWFWFDSAQWAFPFCKKIWWAGVVWEFAVALRRQSQIQIHQSGYLKFDGATVTTLGLVLANGV